MMLEGTLKEHCLTMQQQAEELMDVLIKQMSREQGLDEKLKALDQMKWVRMMNNIRASAEEMVCNEIIYI
jgi:hypothetical protein